MIELIRQTQLYREIEERGDMARATLVLFPDAKYLRTCLIECAKAFFGAEDGSREAILIDKESYLDCKVLPPAGGKLSAEHASFLSDDILLSPAEGKRKLYVLDAFDTVTPLVQNKLLKMLEEPPRGVWFLLGACVEQSILKTVLSRVNKRSVPRFSAERIAEALKRNYRTAGDPSRAAAMSGGLYSAAERMLLEHADYDFAISFLRGNGVKVAREVGEKKSESFLSVLRQILRDMLFCKVQKEQFCAIGSGEIRELAARYSEAAILRTLEGIDRAEREIKFNTPLAQAVYTLFLTLSGSGLSK